ncbi:MAG: DoxX family protein [Legionella sp.]|nr:DoxX family protein [Legionella sp.]
MSVFAAFGPFLIGAYFVFFGIWNACHWRATRDVMADKNIPLPALTLTFGIILESIAGIALMLNIYIQFAALLLIPFTLAAIFIFHAFWTDKSETRGLNMTIFITNLTCTLGALCLLIKG